MPGSVASGTHCIILELLHGDNKKKETDMMGQYLARQIIILFTVWLTPTFRAPALSS